MIKFSEDNLFVTLQCTCVFVIVVAISISSNISPLLVYSPQFIISNSKSHINLGATTRQAECLVYHLQDNKSLSRVLSSILDMLFIAVHIAVGCLVQNSLPLFFLRCHLRWCQAQKYSNLFLQDTMTNISFFWKTVSNDVLSCTSHIRV